MISLDRYGVKENLNHLFAVPVVSCIEHRTTVVSFYLSSKKVTLLRWKEAADGLVLKKCEE